MSPTARELLADEARRELLEDLVRFAEDELDRTLSAFQAERLLDFLLARVGPPVYNRAIRDAGAFVRAKLDDLEGDVWLDDAG